MTICKLRYRRMFVCTDSLHYTPLWMFKLGIHIMYLHGTHLRLNNNFFYYTRGAHEEAGGQLTDIPISLEWIIMEYCYLLHKFFYEIMSK